MNKTNVNKIELASPKKELLGDKNSEIDLNDYKYKLNNLIIENSSYRKQVKFFKEEMNKFKKILSKMKDNSDENNYKEIQQFLIGNNIELEEIIKQNVQIIEESNKDYNLVCTNFYDKFGENSELFQFENQIFLLTNLYEAKEREGLYLETFYNNIIKPNCKLALEYFDFDHNVIHQILHINLNDLIGSYASLSKQIINMKSKNESILSTIKVQ